MKTPKPTPAQKEALQRIVADSGRLIYVTGGFWTTPNCPTKPFSYQGRTTQIPSWSVTRGTMTAMEARGWLVPAAKWRDAPRGVTALGVATAFS